MCDTWEEWSTSYIIDIISVLLGCLICFCLNFKQDGLACELFIFSVLLEFFVLLFRRLFKTCYADYIVSLIDVVAFPTVEVFQVFIALSIVSFRTSPRDVLVWLKTSAFVLGSFYRVPRTCILWRKESNKWIRNLSILLYIAVLALYILTL